MLEVGFFGQPRFALDGAPFRLSVPPKALLILAHLLLRRGTAVSRDAISFTLWPDDTEDEARGKLRKYLYRLMKALPESAPIRTDGDTLAWSEDFPLRFDVADFEDAFAHRRYDDAIASYAGDLLDGFYDDWVLALRERYRADFFAALDDRLLAARRARDLAEAQAYAHRILAADPWREDVIRALMTIRYESGDRIGALRIFDEFAVRVREEMDVAPMSDTTALREAILRGTLRVPGETTAGERTAESRGTVALVGRDREVSVLRRAWQRAARGRGETIILSGEAGIGKTRLAQELAVIAQAEGARVLWGAASPGGTRPYQAIVEAIEQNVGLFADIALERRWLDTLARLIPELHDVVAAGAPPPIAPEREQHRLIDAIVYAIRAIAASRPAILVLEDVQWSSTATTLAIERLSGMADASLLVVLTQRDDETAATPFRQVRNRLVASARVQVLPVGRLTRDAILQFVRATSPEKATAEYVESIERLSAGNPLLMLSSLQAESGIDAAALPAAKMLLQRFDALSDEAARFAEFAAIAGSRFGFDLVREAVTCSERDAFDAVNELQDARVIEELPQRGAFELRFTHELLRDALYERIEPSIRKRRHGRIARVLELLCGDDLRLAGEIAEHYERGGDLERAGSSFVRAAEYAMSVFAHAEARALARQGLATQSLGRDLRRRALWVVGEASWRLGDLSDLRSALIELERGGSGAEETCRILRLRSELEFAAGDRPARLHTIEKLERIAAAAGLRDWLAAAHVERMHSDLYAGSPQALEAARAQARHIEDLEPKTAVRLLAVLCTASTAELAGDAAAAYAAQVQAIADRSGDPALRSVALKAALSVAHQHQDYTRVRELASSMIDLAHSVGDSLYEAGGYAYLANASYGLGDVESTRRAYAEAIDRLERVGDRANLMRAALNCAVFECEEGLYDESQAHARRAQEEARRAGDRTIQHRASLVLATIESERAQYAEARGMLDALLDESDVDAQTRTGVLEESGRVAIGEADFPRAIADSAEALRGFEALSQRWYARRARAQLALANALGGHPDRARALADALRRECVDGQPPVFAQRVEKSLALCGEALASATINGSSDRATVESC
jgi:DNA-binding SARP family transcriptional activator/tetratricopeptide (TPR) repeat protein